MKHYGDITKINGAEVPIVDICCGGSPCQDLSVAGHRKGLSGERSALFMEQIRIVKEQRDECIRQLRMRGADVDLRHIRPRFMVWENVPGAFSSNKGEDFRCVLEEICRIADQASNVPMPEKGRWSTSGCIMGDGWSIAWRVHDAQFWGVPQRRKRIALVADFGGESAPKILFERKGMSGDSEQGGTEREESARAAETGLDKAISFQERAGCEGGVKESSSKTSEQHPSEHNAISQSCGINGETAGTLDVSYYKGCGERQGIERDVVCVGNGQLAQAKLSNKAGALNCMHEQQCVMVYGLDRASFNQGRNAKYDFSVEEEKAQTLVSRGPGGVLTKQSEHCAQEISKG